MTVNRGDSNQEGQLWTSDKRTFVDLMTGQQLKKNSDPSQLNYVFPIEANGFAAILCVDEVDQELQDLLDEMKTMTTDKPLSSFDDTWKWLTQEMVGMNSTASESNTDPENMKLIPRNQKYFFQSNGTE